MDLNSQSQHQNEDFELLEDSWFFGNLLQTKPRSRMLRSFSDPCSSSNFPGKSYEETYESINKLPSSSSSICRDRKDRKKTSLRNALARAPSLPTSLETRDFDDDEEEEMEFSMGKLIRQASLNHSDNRPPRTKISSRRKAEADKLMKQKSLKDVEAEELRGFKDLRVDLDENVVNIVQEKKGTISNEDKRSGRQYRTEAWGAAPPVPRWGGGKRSTEDMKAHIKFWARAVASNVRQEC